MDAALPQLGPGTQPADSPLRGAADTIPVEKESLGQGIMEDAAVPSLIPSASIVLPESPILFQRPGVGRAHEKKQSGCFIFGAKNLTFLYRTIEIGNTINRKINRHQIQSNNSTEYGTYLNLIGRIFPS